MAFLYQRKVERVREAQRRQRERENPEPVDNGENLPPEIEEPKLSEQMEKGDMFAMMLSAFLTIFLPAVLVLLALAGLMLLVFGVI